MNYNWLHSSNDPQLYKANSENVMSLVLMYNYFETVTTASARKENENTEQAVDNNYIWRPPVICLTRAIPRPSSRFDIRTPTTDFGLGKILPLLPPVNCLVGLGVLVVNCLVGLRPPPVR